VGWLVPFHFTVASVLKLVPLIVKVKPGLPAFALSGASSAMCGTIPAAGGVLLPEESYPPQPTQSMTRNKTGIVLIDTSSNRSSRSEAASHWARLRCVKTMSIIGKENVGTN